MFLTVSSPCIIRIHLTLDVQFDWLDVQFSWYTCRNNMCAPTLIDFAIGISIRISDLVLSVVLLPELQQAALNCSWRFPQGSTRKLRKLLNSLMRK